MSDKTGIEWTEATWNPVTGCSKVSQGCKHCYAERDWPRLSAPRPKSNIYTGRNFTDVRCHPERLDQPLLWTRPRRIFVNSMSDLFHSDVPDSFIRQVFGVMATEAHHTFQVLTKRAARMRDLLTRWRNDGTFQYHEGLAPANVWLGVSVEDQATADERIPLLLQTPATVRWVSAEPLLGPVDLTKWLHPEGRCTDCRELIVSQRSMVSCECGSEPTLYRIELIDWLVAGGESGSKSRPMHPAWARGLRDQCAAAGVAFLFKQWGEWHPRIWQEGGDVAIGPDGGYRTTMVGDCEMVRCGKKAAGRHLDGVLHDEYPAA
ncbi:MAG: phage Gp37/Gp68 family protein [Candidatus Desulfobacillus denitrificans]